MKLPLFYYNIKQNQNQNHKCTDGKLLFTKKKIIQMVTILSILII